MMTPLLAAVLVSSVWAQEPAWQSLAGDGSRVAAPRAVIVANPAAWERLWREHAGSDVPAPDVDFTQERVVAVFLGRRPTTGYKVEFVAESSPEEVIVTCRVKKPSSFAATLMTSPFAIRRVAARQVRLVLEGGGPPLKLREAQRAPRPPVGLSDAASALGRLGRLGEALAGGPAFDSSSAHAAVP